MRKRELVHMHALLDRVRRFMHARGDLPDERLEAYDRLDVAPTAVYESKGAHERAVGALAASLASVVDEREEEEESTTSEGTHASPRSD
jgi:hypothetical protein